MQQRLQRPGTDDMARRCRLERSRSAAFAPTLLSAQKSLELIKVDKNKTTEISGTLEGLFSLKSHNYIDYKILQFKSKRNHTFTLCAEEVVHILLALIVVPSQQLPYFI